MVKVRPEDPARLTDFKVLTFDVYSTLIDEEGGMYTALLPLLSQLAPNHPLHPTTPPHNRTTALSAFAVFERALQTSNPTLPYSTLLSHAYTSFAASLSLPPPSLDASTAFGASIPTWPAFPDTVAALQSLARYYKLVLLSNIDNRSIAATCAGPLATVPIAAVYTAQDIGSYKPALANFTYLVQHVQRDLDIPKECILHTANSLRCDHVPAKTMGLASAWIDREPGEEALRELGAYESEGEVAFTWRFATMGEMARVVEEAFAELESSGKGE